MKKEHNTRTIIITFIILFQTLNGQFTTDVDISSYYDNNIFLSPTPVSDQASLFSLTMRYQPESKNISYYYNGNILLYRTQNLYNSHTHYTGLDYYTALGKTDRSTLYLGSAYALKFNHADYDYYNFQQLYLYANMRFLFNSIIFKTGYNFRYRDYANYREISNLRHYFFGQFNKSFFTRTTALIEADLGFKQYPNQGAVTTLLSGRGRGSAQAQYPTGLNYNQLIILARLAQSLHPSMGLYIQFRKQIIPIKSQEMIYTSDYTQIDELFDDPFSYETNEFSSQLTWLLPYRIKLMIQGETAVKTYPSQAAYISAEDVTASGNERKDYRKSVSFTFDKILYLNKNWVKSLQFMLNYRYINNSSNSYWYRYTNEIFQVDISWQF